MGIHVRSCPLLCLFFFAYVYVYLHSWGEMIELDSANIFQSCYRLCLAKAVLRPFTQWL